MARATLEHSVRTYANELFAGSGSTTQKYNDLIAFLAASSPSNLWKQLHEVQPARDIRALAKWAKSIEHDKLKVAKQLAFHLTHPAGNTYGIECCVYRSESFDAPVPVSKGRQLAIPGLLGLVECGNIIGIDREDAPAPDVVLADRYIPLVYSVMVLTDWMSVDANWFGGECDVYLVNFGVEAIPLGQLCDGKFIRTQGNLFQSV